MFDHSPVGRNVRLGTQMRYMLAQRVFKKCGKKVRIFHEVELSFGYNLTVGDGVTIHRNVLIDDRGEVVIGDDASISDYANIYSHSHAVEDIQDVSLAQDRDRRPRPRHVPLRDPLGRQGGQGRHRRARWASPPSPSSRAAIVGGIPAKPIAQKSVKP